MQRSYFRCPISGDQVDIGVESDLATLLRIRSSRVHCRCPFCGERHEWRVSEAQLAKAA